MKTKIVIEFQDRYHSATISIVDETGNGQIVMSGAVNGGAASDEAYAKAKELLTEMVRNMNDYRTVNGYDLLPIDAPSWIDEPRKEPMKPASDREPDGLMAAAYTAMMNR